MTPGPEMEAAPLPQAPTPIGVEARTGRALRAAWAGGAVGALGGGIGWALVTNLTGYEVGYVAVGAGFLAGHGASLAATPNKLQPPSAEELSWLPWIAAACAVVGLVIGKYLIFAHEVGVAIERQQGAGAAAELQSWSPSMLMLFGQSFLSVLTPFDGVWAFIALGTAWNVARAKQVDINRARGVY
jgi:hypothetical protein